MLTTINPATEEPVGSAPDAGPDDIDAAVQAARAAFRESGWPQLAPKERARYLRALADEFEKRNDELGALVTMENGMALSVCGAFNGIGSATRYRYFAGLAESWDPEEVRDFPEAPSGPAKIKTIVRRQPAGVVGIIVPWNVPRATGGDATGAALVAHPGIDMVAFTGSSAVGRRIAAACGGSLKRVTLELGGKSAGIVLEDADLDLFAATLGSCSVPYSGQSCRASTRILAPAARYDEVVDTVAGALAAMPVGDPLDPSTVIGPLVSAAQRNRVEGYIELGKSEGAKLALGGGRPKGLDRGYYVEPTVFSGVRNDMRIAREEIFGPVLVVIRYDNEEEAVAIANDSEYGLGGTVFTRDVEHGLDIARRVETGSIGVNFAGMAPNAPFGGVKSSGIGRESGPEGFEEYLTTKSIARQA
ncbi:MAG TPA: aldehyde dehydrogenase family protein [Trebonia sp.]|nr:aldehyde dehydrogenase family protein [Trebonia sp.]